MWLSAAAGSEQIIVPDLHGTAGGTTAMEPNWYYLPIAIPAGVRIAARHQVSVANNSLRIAAYGIG